MKNHVTVTVAGQEYTLMGNEEPEYIRKVARRVDKEVRQVIYQDRVSMVAGAVLAALNLTDLYFKEQEAAENLRRQLKEYLEDSAQVKLELAEAKREIFRLQNKK